MANIGKQSSESLSRRKRLNQGRRFGMLVATEWLGNNVWRCRCDCGGTVDTKSRRLAGRKGGKGATHCGCRLEMRLKEMYSALTVDLVGKTFGAWEVVARAGSTPGGSAKWRCRCAAGHWRIAAGKDVKRRGRVSKCELCEAGVAARRNRLWEEADRSLKEALAACVWLERADEAWHKRQLDHRRAKGREWKKLNPDKVAAAGKNKAKPAWLPRLALDEVYAKRREVSERTGVEHHVDHIVPLHGKTVCGLHVPWNLQVLPAKENHTKNDRLLPWVARGEWGEWRNFELGPKPASELPSLALLASMRVLPSSEVYAP